MVLFIGSRIKGVFLSPKLEVVGKTKGRGTKVIFKPDHEIFEEIEFSFDVLANRLRDCLSQQGDQDYAYRRSGSTGKANSFTKEESSPL